MIQKAYSGLIDFLFPKSSLVYELESLSPDELLRKLPGASEPPKGTVAIWSYADSRVRNIIWELKYKGNRVLAKSLATVALDVLRQELIERTPFESNLWADPLLLPMPASAERRRERGFCQIEILAEEMDRLQRLNQEKLFTYAPALLFKTKHTESQTKINKKNRLINVENTMEAKDGVRGRAVIVLDDVTTTGASFKESRRALRLAGAKHILCLSLAH